MTSIEEIIPPNSLWTPLDVTDRGGFLSFYYSDSNSMIPVRDITRLGDSKSDPNLETKTYGMFSTCEEDMRRGLVNRGIEHIFFCTARTRGKVRVRVLTGYYHIRWYRRGHQLVHHKGKADYWMAADEIRFVNPGFPLADLTGYLRGVKLDIRFRRYLYLGQETVERLLELIRDVPDKTGEYIKEIGRLETTNLQKHGFTYPNWKKREGFDWKWAAKYLENKKSRNGNAHLAATS